MRIVQILPTLGYGDAIGNEVLAIDAFLKQKNIPTMIYAKNIDRRITPGVVKPAGMYRDDEDTLILYHFSTGDDLNLALRGYKAKVILRYHNITPPEFWRPYSAKRMIQARQGLQELQEIKDVPVMCLTDSDFNQSDLKSYGFSCEMHTVPILMDFAHLGKETHAKLPFEDGKTTISFFGRIAPNKKQEDLVSAFYYYRKYKNPESRLVLVGSYSPDDPYYQKLRGYIDALHLSDDVILTGHIPFDTLLAYYHRTALLLCLSEHEGFCVPLVEAMYFKIPIIAYDCTAVGETLGTGGLLLKDKDPVLAAEAIDRVMCDRELNAYLLAQEAKQLENFQPDKTRHKLEMIIDHYSGQI